jgi:large subunit ribosomal protein L17
MRHRRKGRHLGCNPARRKALVRGLVRSLLVHGHVQTTEARAKAIRPDVDHLVTLAKRGDLHARRQALARLPDRDVVKDLFDMVPDRFADRTSGFTKMYRLGRRLGDGSPLARLELM